MMGHIEDRIKRVQEEVEACKLLNRGQSEEYAILQAENAKLKGMQKNYRDAIKAYQAGNKKLKEEVEKERQKRYSAERKIQSDKISHTAYYGKTTREEAILKTKNKDLRTQLDKANEALEEAKEEADGLKFGWGAVSEAMIKLDKANKRNEEYETVIVAVKALEERGWEGDGWNLEEVEDVKKALQLLEGSEK